MADWSDFEVIRHGIRNNTVDRLKQIATGLNEQCFAHITKSGKKQDLIERITDRMDAWKMANAIDKWTKAKFVFDQVRAAGIYSRVPSYGPVTPTSPVYSPGPGPQSLNTYASSTNLPIAMKMASNNSSAYSPNGTGHTPLSKYDPYAPPRKAVASSSSALSIPKPQAIRFKTSPFFRVESQISAVIECPESTGTMDRRSQSLNFSLTPEQVAKLRSLETTYQLRLYCTSGTFYNPHGFRSTSDLCPIEFPPTCEVRVNTTAITANLKGLKKKPGSAPPAEIPVSQLRMEVPGFSNKIEMVYVNSQQPVQSKKYYLVVFLVEVTTSEQLVSRLNKGKYRSAPLSKEIMLKNMNDDDDIILDRVTLSLRCPLTYVRIKTPCRSSACVHPQCFDAISWYQMMEQTTTWLCPTCEKMLNTDELIVDGYVDEILQATASDEDVDDVTLEADCEWHTSDNKFASAGWRRTHPLKASQAPTPVPATNGSAPKIPIQIMKDRPVYQEVVSICDSDEEEEESFVQRELSRSVPLTLSSAASSSSSRPPQVALSVASSSVIDLTLDSDEEDARARSVNRNTPLYEPQTHRSRSEQQKRKDRHDLDDHVPFGSGSEPPVQRIRIDGVYSASGHGSGSGHGAREPARHSFNGYEATGHHSGMRHPDTIGYPQHMNPNPNPNPNPNQLPVFEPSPSPRSEYLDFGLQLSPFPGPPPSLNSHKDLSRIDTSGRQRQASYHSTSPSTYAFDGGQQPWEWSQQM